MEQVGSSYRDSSSRCLDDRKRRVIVHQIIGDQDFPIAPPPQVQS
jgi:hypothetical protein